MIFFELEATDISALSDGDLRELVARLCEAELIQQGLAPSAVTWGGAQEAPDGGLDVKVENAQGLHSPNFVPRENTGFQVKKHSMGRSACKKEMEENGIVKPILGNLADLNGAYIIVSGKDDCTGKMVSERLYGMKETANLLPNKENLYLDFYGRDRLLNWLRRHPSVALWVRCRLGKPLAGWSPYGRWAAAPQGQDDEFIADDHLCVTDANSVSKEPVSVLAGLQLTRDRLRKPGSTVRLTGLSGVGKTRFAQALFEGGIGNLELPACDVIYADLGNDLTPPASELAAYLIANNFASYLVLDNCPPDIHRNLQKQVSQNGAKLHLLTIEYDISDDKPEETEVINLEPSSELTVSKLVQKRFPEIGQFSSTRIAEFAGGNARVALALASRVSADETLSNFSDEDLFRRLFMQRKGASADLLQSAEALALVYSFSVLSSSPTNELCILGAISGIDRQRLHRAQAELMRRQLIQQRANWRAILPHALANRLAKRALQNISPHEINSELFKTENLRIFQSCAHRLGYLHDFKPAQELATSWIEPGAPLHDISSCSEGLLAVIEHVAPVFPNVVLRSIHNASATPGFASRKNENFIRLVRLLCHLAYEDDAFDQAASILLKFAETEKADENSNSISSKFQQLFSLHLSGTEATPERRQRFIQKLINSEKPEHRIIAGKLLNAALEAAHWSSFSSFHFGARKRGSGWQPKNQNEKIAWYVNFIQLLLPAINSTSDNDSQWAKSILADHFRGLWSFVGCFEILEEIVQIHGRCGRWPEMWISIKQTINYDGEQHSPETLLRLESLEKLCAPADLYSEIRAYVLTSVWDHADVGSGGFEENVQKISDRITKLGILSSANLHYIYDLGPQLWKAQSQSLWAFGRGLALGAEDHLSLFKTLLNSFITHRPEHPSLDVMLGFIRGLYELEPRLSRQITEWALEVIELRPYSVDLLCSIPITSWAAEQLLKLSRSSTLEPWRFERISYGRIHESIPDKDLSPILTSLLTLDKGYLSVLQILSMRLFGHDGYSPSDEVRDVALTSIRSLISANRDEYKNSQLHGAHRVFEKTLCASTPPDQIKEIIELLCEGIATFRIYAYELDKIIGVLIQKYPEIILDTIFTDGADSRKLAYTIFRDRIGRREITLNDIPHARLIAWCGGNQERIMCVATAVHTFTTILPPDVETDSPKNVVLSEHIKALLEEAPAKMPIIEIIFNNVSPDSWSSSLAEILSNRAVALEELFNNPDKEVRSVIKTKLELLHVRIQKEREREAADYNQREQRFE